MGTIGGYDFFRGAQGNMRTATNAAAASAINDVPLKDGELVYVSTFRAFFALRKGSSTTADGVTVLATLSGTARLERLPVPHPSWALQSTWFVDAVSGNDENTGIDSSHAVKTHGEIERRLCAGGTVQLDQVTTITLLTDVPKADPVRLNVLGKRAGLLRYRGTPTQVGSASTFTSVTAIARASNQGMEVVDTAGVLGANVNQRIRITSGARAGATAWIAADLGSSRVRTSAFCLFSDTQPVAFAPTVVTPVAGDPYVIETLTKVAATAWLVGLDADYALNTQGVNMTVKDIDLRTNLANALNTITGTGNGATMTVVMAGCDIGFFGITAGTATYLGCRHHASLFYMAPLAIIGAGLITSRLSLNTSSQLVLDWDTLAQGATTVRVRSGAVFRAGTFAVFGATDGVLIEADSGGARFDGGYSGVAGVYGSGNSGVGVKVEAGAKLNVGTPSTITLTGTAGDVRLGGALTGRAFDDSAGTYTAARTFSWANLALAVASGGFGSNMNNPNNNAGVVVKQ